MQNGWISVENSLPGYNDRRMAKARFSTLRNAEIEIDDITRVRHRATQSHRE